MIELIDSINTEDFEQYLWDEFQLFVNVRLKVKEYSTKNSDKVFFSVVHGDIPIDIHTLGILKVILKNARLTQRTANLLFVNEDENKLIFNEVLELEYLDGRKDEIDICTVTYDIEHAKWSGQLGHVE
jgi:hypothetical protein